MKLIGSIYDNNTDVYTFFYYNEHNDWYYEMSCRNVFGTKDMNNRVPTITREEFLKMAGDRLV
jgi:hypothetical protein